MTENIPFAKQREAIKHIEEEEEQLRNKKLADLEAEKEAKLKMRKEEIIKKFTLGPEDEEELKT